MVAWQRARMQIHPGRTNPLETFKNMQKNSELLKNINSHILIGAPPMKKSEYAQGVWNVLVGQTTVETEASRKEMDP